MDEKLFNDMNAPITATSVGLSLLIGMLRDNGTITNEQLSELTRIRESLLAAPNVEERNKLLAELLERLL